MPNQTPHGAASTPVATINDSNHSEKGFEWHVLSSEQ